MTADGRLKEHVLGPFHRVSDAPAEAIAFLANAARALGHDAVFQRWWCPACHRVFAWEDMYVGPVQGTAMWLVACPTAECPGIDWINLRDYESERKGHPDWPAEPRSGQQVPA